MDRNNDWYQRYREECLAHSRTKKELEELREKYKNLDKDTAEIETLIIMNTDFTGDPPYVGWKGLHLALKQRLEKDNAFSG